MPEAADLIQIEVVYALPAAQTVIALGVPYGTSVGEAIIQSGILEKHPEIDVEMAKIGIFGTRVRLSAPLNEYDRVEIYRPLQVDPKQARLGRARKVKSKPR